MTDPGLPELSVAYLEKDVRDLYAQHGLTLIEPIHYGFWSGKSTRAGRQDLVVARRAG